MTSIEGSNEYMYLLSPSCRVEMRDFYELDSKFRALQSKGSRNREFKNAYFGARFLTYFELQNDFFSRKSEYTLNFSALFIQGQLPCQPDQTITLTR